MTEENKPRGGDCADARVLLAPLPALDVDDVTAARILAVAKDNYNAQAHGSSAADGPMGPLRRLALRWRQAEPLMAFAVAAVYMTLVLRAVFSVAPGSM